jgi:methionyl aminopeptidase
MSVLTKTPSEIAKMRTAGRLAAQVLEMIGPFVQPGISTGELERICRRYIIEDLQAIPASLGHQGFSGSICTSINHVVCHGIPSDKKYLQSGDIINIDVTVKKDEYIGDTSKMFLVGQVKPWALRLVEVTQVCLYKAIALVRPGTRLGDIGHVIQQYAESHGYSVVREYGGHGIGRQMWEEPQVLHYGKPNTGMALEAGMTFTIEPMINQGKSATRQLADGWTVVTKDHSLSAQWEHTVLVTENGAEVLTRRQEELFRS